MGALFKFRSGCTDGTWPQAARRPAGHGAKPAALSLSVVVTTRGRLPQLMRCLQALLAQDIDQHRFEILVVDEARDKATRRAVQALARTRPPHLLHYLRPLAPSRGPAAARNRGWRAARAPLIALTDEEAVPAPSWLREGDAAMHAQRCVALAGCVVRQRDGGAVPAPAPATAAAAAAGPRRVVLDSTNLFVWRKALHAIGGFDERFPDRAHEDADLQFRLQREGPVGCSAGALVALPRQRQPWPAALRRQRNRFFDALLYREHPQQATPPVAAWPCGSYAIVALALAAVLAALAGQAAVAQWLALGSLAGIGARAVRHLRSAVEGPPGPLLEVLATSALIPFLAVYWRLRGAWHYRVWRV